MYVMRVLATHPVRLLLTLAGMLALLLWWQMPGSFLAIWLGQNAVQISLLVGVLFLVLIVELLNSSIEAVVDRIGDEPHRLSGRAKDMGSAAVFLSLLLTVVVWSMIAVERFFPDFALF